METLTIKIKDNKTLKLIRDLEDLNLIQVVNPVAVKKSTTKLSTLLSGSISPEQGDKMQKEVKQMRDEWERNTY